MVPNNIYELLTPVALAHWIMGDGSHLSQGIQLCTDSFSLQDTVKLMNVLIIRYNLKTTMKENIIIKLDIKINNKFHKDNIITNKSKTIKISLVDSLNLLNSNLDKLAKDFNVETKKGHFPHLFVKNTNLNYLGNKPDISYYKDISDKEYNNINKNN